MAAPGDDPYIDAGTTSRGITAVSGGTAFESLAFSTAAVGTTVPDTVNATTLTLGGGPAGAVEGSTATGYTLTLSNVAQSAVTATLSYSGTATNGADYTGVTTVVIPSGSASATFNIAIATDTLAEGVESFTVGLSGTSGGNFESLVTSGTGTTSIYNARDDYATVDESALSSGSGGGASTASGNMLSNDGGPTQLSNIAFGGTTVAFATAATVQTLTSTYGTLTVTGSGAYTYTLNASVDNDSQAGATGTSYEEAFTYTPTAGGAATLRVSIADDAPIGVDGTVNVPFTVAPKYTITLVLDVSGSMAPPYGAVKLVNADGSVTNTDRLTLAKQGLVALVDEYFRQSPDVEIKFVTFAAAATFQGNFTTEAGAVAAINAATAGGGTNYEDAVNTVRDNWIAVDPARQNFVYFLSDGVPSVGNTVNPVTANYDPPGAPPNESYVSWAANQGIKSYGVGIGTGVSDYTHLNAIHNVDMLGDGVVDPALAVPDLSTLSSSLLSTVPQGAGGNVASNGVTNSIFGADGGVVSTIVVNLDLDSNGTPETP
ncbi:MAG: immunoglobulin-like domain-containing protein, partial [Actinomycetota bacterium]